MSRANPVLPRLLACLALALLLAACSGTPREPEVQGPAWLLDPAWPGHVAVIGSALPQANGGQPAQRRAAELMARAELARLRGLQVKEQVDIRSVSDGRSARSSIRTATELSTIQPLDLSQARTVEQWVHPRTGELFLLIVVPAASAR